MAKETIKYVTLETKRACCRVLNYWGTGPLPRHSSLRSATCGVSINNNFGRPPPLFSKKHRSMHHSCNMTSVLCRVVLPNSASIREGSTADSVTASHCACPWIECKYSSTLNFAKIIIISKPSSNFKVYSIYCFFFIEVVFSSFFRYTP